MVQGRREMKTNEHPARFRAPDNDHAAFSDPPGADQPRTDPPWADPPWADQLWQESEYLPPRGDQSWRELDAARILERRGNHGADETADDETADTGLARPDYGAEFESTGLGWRGVIVALVMVAIIVPAIVLFTFPGMLTTDMLTTGMLTTGMSKIGMLTRGLQTAATGRMQVATVNPTVKSSRAENRPAPAPMVIDARPQPQQQLQSEPGPAPAAAPDLDTASNAIPEATPMPRPALRAEARDDRDTDGFYAMVKDPDGTLLYRYFPPNPSR